MQYQAIALRFTSLSNSIEIVQIGRETCSICFAEVLGHSSQWKVDFMSW